VGAAIGRGVVRLNSACEQDNVAGDKLRPVGIDTPFQRSCAGRPHASFALELDAHGLAVI
jgi:hypothetical protein